MKLVLLVELFKLFLMIRFNFLGEDMYLILVFSVFRFMVDNFKFGN